MSKKLMRCGIGLIIISAIIAIIINERFKLDKPVFLKSYCEYLINYSEESDRSIEYFQLKYITDINDKRQVKYIVFDGLDKYQGVSVNNYSLYNQWGYTGESNINESVYGIYSIREIDVSISLYFENPPLENITLTNAEVFFNDGSSEKIELGEIILYYENGMDEAINFNAFTSYADNEFFSSGEINKNITVRKIYSPLFKYCKDSFNLFLNDTKYEDVEGMKYEVGQFISYSGKFIKPKDIQDRFSIYELAPKIYYVNAENQNYYERIVNLSYSPNEYNFFSIFKYLKAVGEI